MDDGRWVDVGGISDLDTRPIKVVYPNGVPVLLVRKDGEIFAMSNRCPHLGCPLSSGSVSGHVVTCPCHDWSFDMRTGELTMAMEVKVPIYRTRMSEGRISIELEE